MTNLTTPRRSHSVVHPAIHIQPYINSHPLPAVHDKPSTHSCPPSYQLTAACQLSNISCSPSRQPICSLPVVHTAVTPSCLLTCSLQTVCSSVHSPPITSSRITAIHSQASIELSNPSPSSKLSKARHSHPMTYIVHPAIHIQSYDINSCPVPAVH